MTPEHEVMQGPIEFHPLLLRQLAKLGLCPLDLPIDKPWALLLHHINRSYREADQERYLTERSVEISSREMQTLTDELTGKRQELEAALVKLQESESQTRAVLDNAGDGIVTICLRGTIQSWNRTAEAIFGYLSMEAIGQPVAQYICSGAGEEADRRTVFEGCAPLWLLTTQRIEMIGLRNDGARFPLELQASMVSVNSRTLIIAIIRDLTDKKEAEAKLVAFHRKLLDVSRMAGMAEVATSVLHNVGNILNSVNVSALLIGERLDQSRLPALSKAIALLLQHQHELAAFLAQDSRGQQLPGYLRMLIERLCNERDGLQGEIKSLMQGLEHMKAVIAMQQSYAKVAGVIESLSLSSFIDEVLSFHAVACTGSGITVERQHDELPQLQVEKHKLLQILMNLIQNARHALLDSETADRRLVVRTGPGGPDRATIEVIDNGVGIREEDQSRLFEYGFTTKKDGHGFGLHSCALAAREMGGTLSCRSEGLGHGAAFRLEIPLVAPAAAEESTAARHRSHPAST